MDKHSRMDKRDRRVRRMSDSKPNYKIPHDEKVVSVVEWDGKCVIATEHHIYQVIEGTARPLPISDTPPPILVPENIDYETYKQGLIERFLFSPWFIFPCVILVAVGFVNGAITMLEHLSRP